MFFSIKYVRVAIKTNYTFDTTLISLTLTYFKNNFKFENVLLLFQDHWHHNSNDQLKMNSLQKLQNHIRQLIL